ncbi:MAG TPA: hypothetical protein VJW94_19085 [Candidatus Acidoferrum sp.]|nr:hypothetical protein [Candidatus Acidoferrum sp.]
MDDAEHELARQCYGYGRWDAPYWFIGLEEGQAPWENNDFSQRAEAFRKLNRDGLCDCLRFHKEIGECRWHAANRKSGKINLQSTWKYLILLLMAFQDGRKLTDEEKRRDLQEVYQSSRWGMEDKGVGETCVIELSGLPANSSEVSRKRSEETRKLLKDVLPTRIERIQKGIIESEPKFVLMYGITAKEHWTRIADFPLQADIPRKIGRTTYLLARHPAARFKGQKKDQYWVQLGTELREESSRSRVSEQR